MYSLLSAVIGALAAVMIFLNGALASSVGNYVASSLIHLTGLLLVVLLLLLTRSTNPFRHPASPLVLAGGAIGFLTVVFANVGVMRLGVSLTLALGLLGQTISALAIDHFGWFGARIVRCDRRKLASLTLIVSGIAVMAYL